MEESPLFEVNEDDETKLAWLLECLNMNKENRGRAKELKDEARYNDNFKKEFADY